MRWWMFTGLLESSVNVEMDLHRSHASFGISEAKLEAYIHRREHGTQSPSGSLTDWCLLTSTIDSDGLVPNSAENQNGENMTAETFEAYAATRSDARFTDWLRERSEPNWASATEHRFVRDLVNGTLEDAVFRRYLVQDYAFVGTLTSAFGYAIGQAPTIEAKGLLTDFLGTLTDEENDYFERSFDELGVPDEDRTDPSRADVPQAFEDLLIRAALEGDYEETLAVLVPAEWVYLTWATAASDPPERFYLREWIELHDTPEFEAFVEWLRRELDEYGPSLNERRQRSVERLFCRTVALEVAFFDAAYE